MASRTRSWRNARRSPDSPSSPASPAAASAGSSSAALRPGHERELGHRERRTQDRGHPQHVQHVLREPAEAAQDREPQRRRQRRPASLRPPIQQLQRPVLIERPHQFDDEQRVAAGACHLLQQERAGRMAGDLAGEVSRLLHGQRANEHVLGASSKEVRHRPVDVRAVRSRAHRRQQGQRQTSQVPADGVHGPQRQRIGPLQILDGEDDRTRRGELFEDVQHGLHDQPPLVGRTRRRALPVRMRTAPTRRTPASSPRPASAAPRSPSKASLSARNGRSRSSSSQAPTRTRNPRSRANRSDSASSRDLPIPGSPSTSPIRAGPFAAPSSTTRSASNSADRPTNRTRDPPPNPPISHHP